MVPFQRDNLMGEPVKKILLIDEKSSIEDLLKSIFNEGPYQIDKIFEKNEILTQLKKFHAQYEAIVVEKDFSGFDLKEFITDLREESTTSLLPVIEIIKEEDSQVEDNFGSHDKCPNLFFIKMPLSPGILLSLLKSIGVLYTEQKKYQQFITDKKTVLDKFSLLKCSVINLEEAKEMAGHLSLYFVDSDRASKGIYNLLENAIEHGNLDIGYEKKGALLKERKWIEEIQTQLKDKENKKKSVDILLERKKDGSYLQITDMGKGFEWKKFMEVDPSRANHDHGRGITLANKIYFDKVVFNQEGNQVTAFMSSKKKRPSFWD